MADSVSGTVTIGGKIPADKLGEFLAVLRESGAGPDWEGGFPKDVADAAGLLALRDGRGHLHLMDAYARNGDFEELTAWLRDNGVPFDAHCDAHHEWSAYNTVHRPGARDREVVSDNCGVAYVEREKVEAVRKLLRDAPALPPSKALLKIVAKALDRLDDALGEEISPLPPLEVV